MKRVIQPTVSIRPATTKDLPRVFRIAQAKELKAANHQFAERWWIRDFLKLKQPFFVAIIDKRIVGFTLGECATGKVAIRHLTAVEKKFQGHGLGQQLIRAFERECRRRGMTCILLYVSGGRHWERVMEKNGYARGSLVREYQKIL